MNNDNKVKMFEEFVNEEEVDYEGEFKPKLAAQAIVDDLDYIYSYIEGDETEEGQIAKGKVMDAINQANNLVEYYNKQ